MKACDEDDQQDDKEDAEDDELVSLSMERALADVEMICAAYPDQVTRDEGDDAEDNKFDMDDTTRCRSLFFTLHFPDDVDSHPGATTSTSTSTCCRLQILWKEHYPVATNVQIVSYRCRNSVDKGRLDTALSALRRTAQECMEEEREGCFPCISAALEAWEAAVELSNVTTTATRTDQSVVKIDALPDRSLSHRNNDGQVEDSVIAVGGKDPPPKLPTSVEDSSFHWYTGEPVVVQKSTFVGHVCRIERADQVPRALQELIGRNSKLQRATHNMVRVGGRA